MGQVCLACFVLVTQWGRCAHVYTAQTTSYAVLSASPPLPLEHSTDSIPCIYVHLCLVICVVFLFVSQALSFKDNCEVERKSGLNLDSECGL